jgi:thymidylate synthase
MHQYHVLLKEILSRGDVQFEPRTEEYTIGISAWQSVYDLRKGFPLVTTKEVNPRQPFDELFWKLRGERNVKPLVDKKVHIWTVNAFELHLKRNGLKDSFPKHSLEWSKEFKKYSERVKNDSDFALKEGDLGPVYGHQWRHWRNPEGNETDQLANLLGRIK